jgi:hypothetical protein
MSNLFARRFARDSARAALARRRAARESSNFREIAPPDASETDARRTVGDGRAARAREASRMTRARART